MTIMITDGDLVTGIALGDADGPELPCAMAALPLDRLRLMDGVIVDVDQRTEWHVDAAGKKRVAAAPDRQPLTCAWDAVLLRDGGAWRVSTERDIVVPRIRAEAARRIIAALGGKRSSILSYAVKLNGLVSIGLSQGQGIAQSLDAEQQADVALIWAIDDWETAMIGVREALIAASDPTFTNDAHWPPPPAGLTLEWLTEF
ncbi:MAG: hypothetical protein ABL908_09970 [Hyphomicrobium sp.]